MKLVFFRVVFIGVIAEIQVEWESGFRGDILGGIWPYLFARFLTILTDCSVAKLESRE